MKSLTLYTDEIKNRDRKALVVYITAGLPGWIEAIHTAQQSGADIVEVGIPFSDPIMDGPVIAQASAKALVAGAKTLDILDLLSNEQFEKPIVIMTYTNILYVHGVVEVMAPLQKANVKGLILPDLTFEQSGLFSEVLENTDISLIQLVASTTNSQRLKRIVNESEGFLYCIAIKGITGQKIDIANAFTDFIPHIIEQSNVATYCGVGVRTTLDAHELSKLSDGVVVGTTVVEKMLRDPGDSKGLGLLVNDFRSAIDQ